MKFKLIAIQLLILAVAANQLSGQSLDIDSVGAGLNPSGWSKQKGAAVEYENEGVQYRTYKPQVLGLAMRGGIFVATEIESLKKGGKADTYCLLELKFNGTGKLVNCGARIKLGEKQFNTAGDAPPNPLGPQTTMTTAEMLDKLASQMEKWGEKAKATSLAKVIELHIELITSKVKP